MVSSIRDNCGIALAHSLEDAYMLAHHQNHRGQDTAGIGYMDSDNGIYVVRWHGLVRDFDVRDLAGLFGHFGNGQNSGMYVSHTKYTTHGSRDPIAILDASHPHYVGDNVENFYQGSHIVTRGSRKILVHNGQIVNERKVRSSLNGYEFHSDCDSEGLLAYCDFHGVAAALREIPLAYSAIIMDAETHTTIAFRDRYGIRPMCLGSKDGKTIIASEDSAIKKIGGGHVKEVTPGSMVFVYPDGDHKIEQIMDPEPVPCSFEYIYIEHPDSSFYNIDILDFQKESGRELYREHGHAIPKDAIVTYVPHRPEFAAPEFARQGEFEYKPLLYKTKPKRIFKSPTQEAREASAKSELHLDPIYREYISGRTIVVIDDSIVRGTNSKQVVELLREAGAKEIYMLSYSPMPGGEVPFNGSYSNGTGARNLCTACFDGQEPIPMSFLSEEELALTGRGTRKIGCKYGVAMPPADDFAAAKWGRDVEKIREAIGVDYLGYLSVEGLITVRNRLMREAAPTLSVP